MKALLTLAAWKEYARIHSRIGCDNLFVHNEAAYSFDAHPRQLQNGALMGRIYRQLIGQPPADIGGFKIEPNGDVSALPSELDGTLPMAAPNLTITDGRAFVWEDMQ